MVANLGTLVTPEAWSADSLFQIVNEWVLSPIAEQLQNKFLLVEFFSKKDVEWKGRTALVPVHLSRNTGVAWGDPAGPALPAAGQQGYDHFIIEARRLYGRIDIDALTMKIAKGNPNSLIDALESELTGCVKDIQNRANQDFYSGGRVLGFLNEHENKLDNNTWEFSGDLVKAAAVLAAVGAAVPVQLRRMDTYDNVPSAGGTGVVTYDTVDATGSTLTLRGNAASAINTSAVATGYAIAVICNTVIDPGGLGLTMSLGSHTSAAASWQAQGIYGILAEPTLFRLDRSLAGAIAANYVLRSNIRTCSETGNHDRADLSQVRMQFMQDVINEASGDESDWIVMHPIMRAEYTSLMNGTTSLVTVTDKAKPGDIGFTSLSFNGIPIKTDRHCGRGLLIFLKTDTWRYLEVGPGEWADDDGSKLSRVAGADRMEAFYRWYYNAICERPCANGILVGVQFSGAVAGS